MLCVMRPPNVPDKSAKIRGIETRYIVNKNPRMRSVSQSWACTHSTMKGPPVPVQPPSPPTEESVVDILSSSRFDVPQQASDDEEAEDA